MAEEQVVPQDWKLVLAQKRFEYRTETLPGRDPIALKQEILDLIKEHDAAPMYEFVCEELDWTPDAGELERLQSAVRAQLDKFEESLKEAGTFQENAGEVEIRDALASKALYLADIGDASAAEPALELARSKTAGASQKLDLTFASLRLNMSLGRWQAVVDTLKSSSTWTRGSIDWERRNKLKVYEAMSAIATRRLEAASALLLDCVVTFSATELMPYQRLVLLTCLCSTLSLSRPERKARVVDCPEIV
ncbi:26S proteasome subunit RPN7, partial [Helicosporidium sp. ATCC 50920]